MEHILQWVLNFTGIDYGQNKFATHMYNFWSGFGGDIAEFALIGTLLTIYRDHINRVKRSHIASLIHIPSPKDIIHNNHDSSGPHLHNQ
jgi:hypothetical protein